MILLFLTPTEIQISRSQKTQPSVTSAAVSKQMLNETWREGGKAKRREGRKRGRTEMRKKRKEGGKEERKVGFGL